MAQPNDRSDDPKPVIEPGTDGAEHVEVTTRALQLRIRQQEILAELGVLALQGTPFLELLNRTARLTADGMEAQFCKVLEYLPAQNRLLVRAGVGWHEGIVGVATVGADLESPSGFALRTGKPVISNHLENEERFRTPELLVEAAALPRTPDARRNTFGLLSAPAMDLATAGRILVRAVKMSALSTIKTTTTSELMRHGLEGMALRFPVRAVTQLTSRIADAELALLPNELRTVKKACVDFRNERMGKT
jgi:hypothetical protein